MNKTPCTLFITLITILCLAQFTHAEPSQQQAALPDKPKPKDIFQLPDIDQDDTSVGIEYFKKKLLRSRQTLQEKKMSLPSDQKPLAIEGEQSTTDLTVQDMIQNVVYYNPAVETARLEWMASIHAANAAWGDFEPELVTEFKRSDLSRENTTLEAMQQSGNTQFSERKDEYNVGIEGKIVSGANYNLGYSLTEQESNLTSQEQEYQSFAGLTMAQPLFKGAWFGAPLAQIRVSKVDRRIAFHNFRSRLMKILYQAESAYWTLSFSEKKYQLAGESVDIAQKLVRDSQERVKTGKMSPLDLVEAEAGLADRLSQQADARQELLEAMNNLKLILSSDKIDKITWLRTATKMYVPADTNKNLSAAYLKEGVFMVQPDYLVKEYELDREKIVLNYQKDQRLPALNVSGSYGYNSMAGSRHDAWEKLKDKKNKVWTLGVEFRLPLLSGIQEKNLLAAEKLKKRTAEESLKAIEYEIVSSLKVLRQRMTALQKRVKNAQKVVEFRKRLLDVELVRLGAGKSNTRVIYEVEEDLAEAKQFELESIVRYREASTQYALISGTLLQDKGYEKIKNTRPVLSQDLIHPRR